MNFFPLLTSFLLCWQKKRCPVLLLHCCSKICCFILLDASYWQTLLRDLQSILVIQRDIIMAAVPTINDLPFDVLYKIFSQFDPWEVYQILRVVSSKSYRNYCNDKSDSMEYLIFHRSIVGSSTFLRRFLTTITSS